MAININRNVDDAFYRYKMPPLQAKVEGKGNGIKTVVANMADVAKALHRPPEYPTKYFGCELGAQTIMDNKNERYIVNGAFQVDRLQDLLDGFIQKFVLCQNCENPETNLRVTSKKMIESTCLACGHRCNLDMTHKLTTFIINHPPNGGNKKGEKLTKEQRRALKRSKQNSTDEDGDAPTTPDDAVDDVDEDDLEWSADTSEAAMAARQREELTEAVASLTMTDDLEKPINERLEMFHLFVEERANKTPFPSKEVLLEAERLDCKEKGVMTIAEFLWKTDSAKDLLRCLKETQGLVQRFVFENKKAQKNLLGALEMLIAKNKKDLLPKVAHILKFLYDLDIIDEENFLAWGEKPSKKLAKRGVPLDLSTAIRQQAQAFLDWLKEADEETSDDDEEDDDVAFDDRAIKAGLVGAEPEPADDDDEDEEDDIDIDDI